MDGGQREKGGGLEMKGKVVYALHRVWPKGYGEVYDAVSAGAFFVRQEILCSGGGDGTDLGEVIDHPFSQRVGKRVGVEIN